MKVLFKMRDKVERMIFLVGAPLYLPPEQIVLPKEEYDALIKELIDCNFMLHNAYYYPGSNVKILSE
jgi:hypothetical protein